MKQREEENKFKVKTCNSEHESYELKWAGERDVEEFRKQCDEECRESFTFRNNEGLQHREVKFQMKAEYHCQEHESYMLKWEGEGDAEEYERKCAEEYRKQCYDIRRKDFAVRNACGSRHRIVMDELKILAHEKEHESYMLKWAGEEDVKSYISEENRDRRESLQFRNIEGKRHRAFHQKQICEDILKVHAEEELQSACSKDVKEYKKQCDTRDRASLCYRRKESEIHRLIVENEREILYNIDQASRDLNSAARIDVDVHIMDCKNRRRLSLACRAKEKRQHCEWKRRNLEKERKKRSGNSRVAALDRKYLELEKINKRAQIAMDAIRHAGAFSINPSSSSYEL